MFHSFLTFINHLGLDLKHQQTILTVSGGIDSVVMAHLFQRAGFKACIAHCNFGLRGEESVMDEEFVRSLALEYGFQFFVKHFETKSYARENGISTQMAARDLRYNWFQEVRDNGFDWIATAHHINDSLETVLLNLSRGTGIAGLRGISPVNGNLLRPLLFATKDELLHYAQENNLTWREDRSNESLDYKRNIIRKKVVPVLKELNPSLESTFQITSEKLQAANSLLDGFLLEWQKGVVTKNGDHISIRIDALEGKPNNSYLLWSVVEPFGFSYIQCTQICASLASLSGLSFYSETHQVLKEREVLMVRARIENRVDQEILISGPGEYFLEGESFRVEECDLFSLSDTNQEVIYLDAAKTRFPLTVRAWKNGDIFLPFGMNGRRKKISDVLIDLKYSLFQKEKVKVLVDQAGEVLWLIGIRASEHCRMDLKVPKFYKITHNEPAG